MSSISPFTATSQAARMMAVSARPASDTCGKAVNKEETTTSAVTSGVGGGSTQSLARGDTAVAAQETSRAVEKPSAREEFLAYQKMTPEQKFRAQFLKQMGLTEEELDSLPPEERVKIEAKLRKMIKEAIEEDIKEKQEKAGANT